jgi:elongation factor Ts
MSVKISAADVKKLRNMTGAGMMDCKKALAESNGDFDAAIEFLRKKGQKLSLKRADREAKEGVVIAAVNNGKDKGVVIRLSCETDFVAKNNDFVNLAKEIAEHALEQFSNTKEDLLDTTFQGIKLSDKIIEQVGVIGEKIELASYETVEAPMCVPYIHMGYRAGVVVGLSKADETFLTPGKDVAMQVAAMKPIAVDENDVDPKTVAKEKEIIQDLIILENQKKGRNVPANIIEKMAAGKLNKFFKERTLMHQAFVKDGKQSVRQYLKSFDKDLTVTEFRHVKLG